MKIYLDNCCYCRPYDGHAQNRVRQEARAVLDAVEFCKTAGHGIVGSPVVTKEMEKIRDGVKLEKVQKFYRNAANYRVATTPAIISRAQTFQAQGLKIADSYHLACAEAADADYLLTTDDDFERISAKMDLTVKVINPLNFLPEWRK